VSAKYQNKYRIPSAGLQTWDYASNGAYFITICTAKRQHYFGQIINGKMELSDQGEMAHRYWLEIPDHFSFVVLYEFVVMPNHVHGIIIIDHPENFRCDDRIVASVEAGHALSLQSQPKQYEQSKQTHSRFRNQGKNTISAMVGSYKSVVTKYCNENKLPFGWQSRFHDHIIRDNDEFHRIKNYIVNNPANWEQDKFFNINSTVV
jgi:putative transposase